MGRERNVSTWAVGYLGSSDISWQEVDASESSIAAPGEEVSWFDVVVVFALILGVFVLGIGLRWSFVVVCGGWEESGSGIFEEQNRILRATLPIKLGIPDNPEVLVLRIAPDR